MSRPIPLVPFPFQNLPLELRRYIIEISALQELEIALTLLMICREYHAWVEPIIYRHVFIVQDGEDNDARLFLSGIREHPSRRESVRSLLVGYLVSLDDAYECVKLCRRVECLAFWSAAFDSKTTHPVHITSAVFSLPLVSLSIYVAAFLPGPDSDFSLLPNVKYLAIVDRYEVWKTWTWKGIALQTNLTHVSFDSANNLDSIIPSLDRLLGQCGRGVKIITTKRLWGIASPKRMGSKLVEIHLSECAPNWARHVKGEDDDWVNVSCS